MVISFQIDKVRNYLLSQGSVYTFRKRKRSVGKTWMNSGRGKPKTCDVKVQFVTQIGNSKDLEPYVKECGLDDLNEWLWYIMKWSKEINGFLYKVTRLSQS